MHFTQGGLLVNLQILVIIKHLFLKKVVKPSNTCFMTGKTLIIRKAHLLRDSHKVLAFDLKCTTTLQKEHNREKM